MTTVWSGYGESNSGIPVWKTDAFPLSYTRELAEGRGFEPRNDAMRYRFSKPALSATQPSLHKEYLIAKDLNYKL